MTETRKWSAVAALVAVVVFVASWLLLISPKRGEAADTRTQTASQEQQNASLRSKIAQLKDQASDLPKKEAELAGIRAQIPTNPALPKLIRELSAAAKGVGVELVSLAPAAPSVLVASSATAVAPVAPGAATGDQLLQVPVALALKGDYPELEQFLNRLEELQRVFLVTGFTIGSADGATAASTGTVISLNLTGRVFMAKAGTAATTPVAPTTTGSTGSTSTPSGTATPTPTPATAN